MRFDNRMQGYHINHLNYEYSVRISKELTRQLFFINVWSVDRETTDHFSYVFFFNLLMNTT
jgi:hypothetical protein